MLVQNQYDGRLYEVPDFAGYGEYADYGEYAEPGYHGLGIPFLAPLAAKIGARLLPKALPFARRFLRRFRRFPGFRRLPFIPGLPGPAGVPSSALLSTRVARKVVAMLRQQGMQVSPAGPQGPPPGLGPDSGPAGPPPGGEPTGGEPQPGVAEYPFDPQAMESEEDPYSELYQQQAYPYQYPYQYPYASMYPSRRHWRRGFPGWGRRWSGWRYPRSYRGRSAGRPGIWRGALRSRYGGRRAGTAYVRPVRRDHR